MKIKSNGFPIDAVQVAGKETSLMYYGGGGRFSVLEMVVGNYVHVYSVLYQDTL